MCFSPIRDSPYRVTPQCGSDSEAASEGEQPAKRIAMGCAGDRHDVRPTPAVGAADHSREGVAGAELESSPMAPEPTAAVEPDGGLAMGWHTAVLEHTEDRWGNNWKQRRWVDAELKRAGVSAEAAREWGVRSVPNRTAEKWLGNEKGRVASARQAPTREPATRSAGNGGTGMHSENGALRYAATWDERRTEENGDAVDLRWRPITHEPQAKWAARVSAVVAGDGSEKVRQARAERQAQQQVKCARRVAELQEEWKEQEKEKERERERTKKGKKKKAR